MKKLITVLFTTLLLINSTFTVCITAEDDNESLLQDNSEEIVITDDSNNTNDDSLLDDQDIEEPIIITQDDKTDEDIVIDENIDDIQEEVKPESPVNGTSSDSKCGDSLFWSFNKSTGVLTISGTGEMYDYNYQKNPAPWTDINSYILTIELPDGLTKIGSSAFYWCESLTSINIPDSVTSIGYASFYYCSSLSSINIPDKVETIEANAFCGCSSLLSIYIPKSVNSIETHAFSRCISLKTMIVDQDNSIYDSRENCNAIIETSTNTLVTGCKKMIIPNTVTSIANYAMDGCESLIELVIPDSVETIGFYAFDNCQNLRKVTVGKGVKTIENYAFDFCPNIRKVVFEGDAPKIYSGQMSNPSHVFCSKFVAYYPAGNLTWNNEKLLDYGGTITWVEGIEENNKCGDLLEWFLDLETGKLTISGKGNMFNYSSGSEVPWNIFSIDIKEVELSEEITSIGDYAFWECSNIHTINLPNTVTRIGDYAFYKCFQDNSYFKKGIWNTITKELEDIDNYYNLILPENLTYLGDYAFYSDYYIKGDVIIPSTLTYLGSYAFYNTRITSMDIQANITSIPEYSFYECNYLYSITLPNSISSICNNAFYNCDLLSSVVFPNNLNTIGEYAFYDCPLVSILFPESLITIGKNAFGYSRLITSIVIPDNVEYLGTYCFYNCDNLNEVVIGKSVKEIDDAAFSDCDKLKKVIFKGDSPYIEFDSHSWSSGYVFSYDAFTAYYPLGNNTWTSDKLSNYGGDIDWIGIEATEDFIVSINATETKKIKNYTNKDNFLIVDADGKKLNVLIDDNSEFIPNVDIKTKSCLSEDENRLVEEYMNKEQLHAHSYLDLYYEFISKNEDGRLADLGVDDKNGIECILELPNETLETNVSKIFRIYDGKIDDISYNYDKNNKRISFEVSKFGLYVIGSKIDFYDISYENINDNTDNSSNPTSYNAYSSDIVFSDPIRPGCIFNGWYLDEELTEITTGIPSGSTGPVIVYASWTPIKYTCRLNGNGGIWYVSSDQETVGVGINEFDYTVEDIIDLDEVIPEYPGYNFVNWTDGYGNVVTSLDINDPKDIELFANWELAFEHKIDYYIDINDLSKVEHSGYNTGKAIVLPSPTKLGYTFAGWYNSYNATTGKWGTKITKISSTDKKDYCLYAKWTENKYKVAYNTNGGKVIKGKLPSTKTYTYTDIQNIKIEDLTFAKNGYRFKGFSTNKLDIVAMYQSNDTLWDGDKLDLASIKNGATITIYGTYELIPYNITLDAKNGTLASKQVYDSRFTTSDGNTYSYDNYTIVDKTIKLPTLTKKGYKFNGWYSDVYSADGTIKKDKNGNTVEKKYTSISKYYTDIDLYAKFTPITYKISYNLNKGKLLVKNTKTDSQYSVSYHIETSEIDLPKDSEISRTGYTFDGWYLDKNFTIPSSELTPDYGKNVTLYAKWIANTYTVLFESDDPEALDNQTLLCTYDKSYKLDKDILKVPGKTVTKWTYDTGKLDKNGNPVYKTIAGNASIKNLCANQDDEIILRVATATDKTTGYQKELWTLTKYTIKYILNGGTNDKANKTSYTRETAGELADPIRKDGAVFNGWYTDFNYTNIITTTKDVYQNLTLYASYEGKKKEITYHNVEEANNTSNPSVYMEGGSLTLAKPTRIGYTFSGWYFDEALTKKASITSKTTGDIEIYAKWTLASKIKAPNGSSLTLTKRLGTPVYTYCGIQIPLGLGLPELTTAQIDSLIKDVKNNVPGAEENVKNSIRTLGDAVCYLIRDGFKCENDVNKYRSLDEGVKIIDLGNIIFGDHLEKIGENYSFYTTLSGKQLLKVHEAQCTAAATLIHYLLWDDYKDVGYIHIGFDNHNGHAMLYIQGNDDKFYLLNPASYLIPYDENGKYHSDWIAKKWLDFYVDEKGCTDTLDELMGILVDSKHQAEPGRTALVVETFSYDGVYCHSYRGTPWPNYEGCTFVLAKDCVAKCWTKYKDGELIGQDNAIIDCSWEKTYMASQDNIINIELVSE